MQSDAPQGRSLGQKKTVLLVLLPFYVNDLFLMGAESAESWLWIDYVSRAISLSLMFAIGANWRDLWRENRISNWLVAIVGLFIAASLGLMISGTLPPWLRQNVGGFVLQGFPGYASPDQRLWDLTLGLALVAISEEILFRWYLDRAIRGFIRSEPGRIFLAATLFALAHWSRLAVGVFPAFLFGVIYAILYRRIGSVWPLAVAHYIVDLMEYSA
jgi:membrane protease YdiL (CAAX protease family)